jgi:hypothetical protein
MRSAFTGASGRDVRPVPVQSIQAADPAVVVFHTCEVGYKSELNPIMPTYAVSPEGSDLSIATEEIAKLLGLIDCDTFVMGNTPAFVVTHTSPPPGVPLNGPEPFVTA